MDIPISKPAASIKLTQQSIPVDDKTDRLRSVMAVMC